MTGPGPATARLFEQAAGDWAARCGQPPWRCDTCQLLVVAPRDVMGEAGDHLVETRHPVAIGWRQNVTITINIEPEKEQS